MTLFLLFSTPLVVAAAAILLDTRLSDGEQSYPGQSYMLVRYAVLPGIFLFVGMYLVSLALSWVVPYSYTKWGLFFYHFSTDFLAWPVMASLGAYFTARNVRDYSRRDWYHVQLFFFGVVFGLLAAADVILQDGFRTVYQIVYLPLARAGIVLLFPLVFVRSRQRVLSLRDQWQWIVLPLYCAGWSVVAMWSEWLRPGHAAGFSLLIVLFTAAVVYLTRPAD